MFHIAPIVFPAVTDAQVWETERRSGPALLRPPSALQRRRPPARRPRLASISFNQPPALCACPEFPFTSEPVSWPWESEWEGEANRSSSDYIRWVQSSLNRTWGLRLAVDGIEGPDTRSAIRGFQQRQGLKVDGIVGPITEAALVAAGAPPPVVSARAAGSTVSTTLPPKCSEGVAANCVVLENFALDDDTLTDFHRQQIVGIARQVISTQERSVSIELVIVGHASPEGTTDYNIDLAFRRATEVENALIDCMEVMKPGSTNPGQFTVDVESCGETEIPGVIDPAKQRRVDVCFSLKPRVAGVHPALRWFETGGTGPYAMQPVRSGNDVEYLIGGRQTFEAMWRAILTAENSNHYIYLLGWWLSNDFELKKDDPDSTIHRLFVNASTSGVQIRAMVWKYPYLRAPVGPGQIGEDDNLLAVNDINTIGEAILDNRTLGLFGSHHQKILIVKGKEGLIAFCGGIDINADRIVNTRRNFGEPFHDVHCRVKGPAAFDLLNIFCERWKDYLASTTPKAKPQVPLLGCSETVPAPRRDATMYVQVARTYPNYVGHQFARRGEQTALRMILKAIREARRFIYIEEPFLVSMDISHALLAALPSIQHLIMLVSHGTITDLNPPFPKLGELREQVYYRRQLFMEPLLAADGNKVGVFYLQNPKSDPPYSFVHSKMMVVDDEFATIGSVNLCRRSLTHDSEAAVGIYDAACNSLPRQLRIALWAYHLGINIDESKPEGRQGREDLADGVKSAALWYNRPGARVALYNKEIATVEPKFTGADAEWSQIDPDGS